MKTLFLSSMMVLSVVAAYSSPAFAFDERTVEVSCRNAQGGTADFGLGVSIVSGGIAGMTMAKIWGQSLAGPRELGSVAVRLNDRGMQRIYTGLGFNLTINLESFAPTAEHPARLSFGKSKADLICNVAR